MTARRIAMLTFPKVQAIDVFGPIEVFSAADRLAGGGEYAVELVAEGRGPIETSSGVRVMPDRAASACRESLNTLIVAGGDGVGAALRERRLYPEPPFDSGSPRSAPDRIVEMARSAAGQLA
jgi:transcriptional regulator GlxA family with amidase domain